MNNAVFREKRMPCSELFKKELLPGHRVNNGGIRWKTCDKFFFEIPIKTPYTHTGETAKEKPQDIITRKKRPVHKAHSFYTPGVIIPPVFHKKVDKSAISPP